MKKTLLLFAFILSGIGSYAQAPDQMNYQGVARNSAGAPLAATPIGLKLTIHDGSSSGTIVYEETQSPTTNAFGLYNVAIGTGSVTTGTWASINWATGNKYLEVSLDPAGGSAYASVGVSQLLSSAYAFYANTAGSATSISGTVPMGGDVTGTNAAATVAKIQGKNISASAPATGQVLQWTGTAWTPTTIGGTGTVTSISTTAPLTGGPITTTGTIGLGTLGTAAVYGDATHYTGITTDAYGRVSAVNVYTVTSSTGTTNYIPKFVSSSNIGNSAMYQSGTKVGLGTITPRATEEVTTTTDTMSGWFSTSVAAPPALHGMFESDYAGTANSGIALLGNAYNVSTNTGTFGVQGIATGVGVDGIGQNNATGTASCRGVQGSGFSDASYCAGVAAYGNPFSSGPVTSYGVLANATGGATNYSGYFFGNVYIGGTLSGSGKAFKIDHPLDPENKYLYHSCVESNDMMNIYNGNITTDAAGVAEVALPSYFEALNQDFRYQLTVMGATFAQAIVTEKVHGNKFTIKTSVPNTEVSWMVTGVRHDAYANANRITPEVEKESYNKGKYLDAKDFGKPESLRIADDLSKPVGQRPTQTTASQK